MSEALHAFDNPIGSQGRHHERASYIPQRLVVERVRPHLPRAYQGGQARILMYLDGVRGLITWDILLPLLVVDGAGALGGQVLIEGASQRHIEHLDATADAEDRHILRQ